MAVLSWGKCTIEKVTSQDGTPQLSWTPLDTPKQDSTQLIPKAGNETTATEEGGDIVDVRFDKTTYEFVFDIFVKKKKERPFNDVDGVVAGEFAFRLTPEDEECDGIQIDRAKVRVEESYKSAEGIMLHHVCKCLKPASGNTVKPYKKSPEAA